MNNNMRMPEYIYIYIGDKERRAGTGITCLPSLTLPKGGQRRSEKSDRLIDSVGEVTP